MGVVIGFLIGRGSTPTRDPAPAEFAIRKEPSVLPLQRRAGDRGDASGRGEGGESTLTSAELLTDIPQPSVQDLKAFLESRGRDAESLAAAYLSGWVDDHLIEAAPQYPDDPLVQWTVLSLGFHETLGGDPRSRMASIAGGPLSLR